MVRGTFANIRLRNRSCGAPRGPTPFTCPTGSRRRSTRPPSSIATQGVPLLVLAGSDYGAGSSWDWAAKGTLLLGVKAVLAKSFERIHRSNLVGMGVLPLEFIDGDSVELSA